MGIKKIKKENDQLNLNLIEMLGAFDTSKTKKYTQFLIKVLNKRIKEYENYPQLVENENVIDKILPLNSWKNLQIRNYVCDFLFSWNQMKTFIEFCELMEKGLIEENDISKYDSWEMLEHNLFYAKNKEMFKKSKKDIKVIFEDEKYLIFKPTSYLASCSYGYQTKWCTAMVNDPDYFYRHSHNGILIYLIDKKENKKFAFYKRVSDNDVDDHEQYIFKTFNQQDKQIDTIQTGLPFEILKVIMLEMDITNPTNLPNYKLFSEDEISKMKYYINLNEEVTENVTRPRFRNIYRRLEVLRNNEEINEAEIVSESEENVENTSI